MKKRFFYLVLSFLVLSMLVGCVGQPTASGETAENFRQVTPEEAKALMDSEEGYVILDVRTPSEYAEGHIPNAICISHDRIEDEAEKQLLDKGQLILVYCRSGNRSKQAANALVKLGYTNVVEFGGIIQWPYEIEQ